MTGVRGFLFTCALIVSLSAAAATPSEPDENASGEVTAPIEQVQPEARLGHGWAWAGGGQAIVKYQQAFPGIGTINQEVVSGLSQSFEAGYLGASNWGAQISYLKIPVRMASFESNQTFNWTTYSAQGVKRWLSESLPLAYSIRVGAERKQVPLAALNTMSDLDLKTNTVTSATAGGTLELIRERWHHYFSLGYAVPISTQASGGDRYTVQDRYAFDGGIGSSFNISEQFKIGLFLTNEWRQAAFHYDNGVSASDGMQTSNSSNLDFRVGLDF